MQDPWNNIYVDGDKIIQVRYRVRVVKDYYPGWNGFIPTTGWVGNVLGYTTEASPYGSLKYIAPQGKLTFVPYYKQLVDGQAIGAIITAYCSVVINSSKFPPDYGAFTHDWYYTPSVISYKGYWYIAIPIALVARRNTGAFHPVYNPNGSAKFTDGKMWWEVLPTALSFNIIGGNIEDTNSDGTNDLFQFYVEGDQTSEIKPNYFIEVTGSTSNDGRYWVTEVTYDADNNRTVITVANEIPSTTFDGSLKSVFGYVKYCFDNAEGGTIESGVSGRPDGLYADEINEGDVKDLRNYALRITDYNKLLEKEFNKLLAGKLRGWEISGLGLPIAFRDFGINGYSNVNVTGQFLISHTRSAMNSVKKSIPKSYIAIKVGDKIIYSSFPIYQTTYNTTLYLNSYISDAYRGIFAYTNNNVPFTGYNRIDFKSFFETITGLTPISGPDGYNWYFYDIKKISVYFGQGIIPGMDYNKNHYFKNILVCDSFGLGWNEKAHIISGDYNESFIPTDDFQATIDSTDTTKCTISGDKRYAIKKNCRLFYRNSDGSSVGIRRVKSVSYDGTNTIVICDGSLGSAGSTINVSTCIAGKSGTTNQVYVFKLSRVPIKANQIKVLIKKKDGTWFTYNDFNPVSVYNSFDIKTFINNTNTDNPILFNSYLKWLAININELFNKYGNLGYTDVEDFKQNVVIEVYYQTLANPLSLNYNDRLSYLYRPMFSYVICRFAESNDIPLNLFQFVIGKVEEQQYIGWDNFTIQKVPIKSILGINHIWGNRQVDMDVDIPSILKTGDKIILHVSLYNSNGKVNLNVYYNEVIYDYNSGTDGWPHAFYLANSELTKTDINGNVFIAGHKSVELPYFVWNEDQDT